MTNASVASNFNQSFDVECNVTTKVTLNNKILINVISQLCNVILIHVFYSDIRINTCGCQDVVCGLSSNTVDIGQSNFDPLSREAGLHQLYEPYFCCTSII